ncbi:HDOD domain-containing protein [Paraglaciecola sp. 2405UD69-4]|uniref:HDOD domain-containing protein n=1 Tax=Paraglaciecola sp. 2405UD69-4 TaxID=3391836 RepID=UPI0039C991FE
MPNSDIKEQYIGLTKLLNLYKNQKLDKDIVKATHIYCTSLFRLAQEKPDKIFAQPKLYKKQLPYLVNVTFNACVYTGLLGVRNMFDPSLTIQLMCASLSMYALDQTLSNSIYHTPKPLPKAAKVKLKEKHSSFLTLLQKFNLTPWISALKLSTLIHKPSSTIFTLESPIIKVTYLANRIAILITPNTRFKHCTFASALKYLASSLPMSWYDTLTPLMFYPGLLPPGSYIKRKNGDVCLVIALTDSSLVTRLVKPGPNHNPVNLNSIIKILTTDTLHPFPAQAIANLDKVNEWWDDRFDDWKKIQKHEKHIEAFPKVLPIQRAPASLLILQDQLKQTNINQLVIEKAIASDPFYSEHILRTAGSSNRQKQKIHTIKHGLAMLGLENSGYLLQQYSLIARLNQEYFPLQKSFLSFSQLMANIAGELAFLAKISTSEMAKSLCYFALSRLFSMPSFRLLTEWKLSKEKAFKLDSLINNSESQTLHKDALLLAKSWQLSRQSLSSLEKLGNIPIVSSEPEKLGYLLGLSLVIAREIYFSDFCDDIATVKFRDKSHSILKISNQDIQQIKDRVITSSEITTQLRAKLT